MKHLASVLLATALISAPALAQTTAPASNPPASTTAAAPANTGHWMTQEKAGQWRASKLKGLNVYNNNNEKIGDIDELLVDSTGKVEAVVIGAGGFLGMGEHNVAVPFSQIKFTNESRREAKKDDAKKNPADTTGSTN